MRDISHILNLIYPIGDAGEDGSKIAIGDPTGARIKIAGVSYARGVMLEDGSPIHGILSGLFQFLSAEHCLIEDVNLKSVGSSYTYAIGGDGTNTIAVDNVIVNLTSAGGALNGNAKITLGISPGGTEVLAATTLTGLNATTKMFKIDIEGLTTKFADDQTLYISVHTADSGAAIFALADVTITYYYI